MNVSLKYFKTKYQGAYICCFQITGPGTYTCGKYSKLPEGVYGVKEQLQEGKSHIILSVFITAFIYTVLRVSVESFLGSQEYKCFLIVLSLDFRGMPKGETAGLQHPKI
jgi:hypothetical protein